MRYVLIEKINQRNITKKWLLKHGFNIEKASLNTDVYYLRQKYLSFYFQFYGKNGEYIHGWTNAEAGTKTLENDKFFLYGLIK